MQAFFPQLYLDIAVHCKTVFAAAETDCFAVVGTAAETDYSAAAGTEILPSYFAYPSN